MGCRGGWIPIGGCGGGVKVGVEAWLVGVSDECDAKMSIFLVVVWGWFWARK